MLLKKTKLKSWPIAGSDYGLRMTINLETYEKMGGPNTDIGIKVRGMGL